MNTVEEISCRAYLCLEWQNTAMPYRDDAGDASILTLHLLLSKSQGYLFECEGVWILTRVFLAGDELRRCVISFVLCYRRLFRLPLSFLTTAV